jgi:transcription termination/antitermination protein NusG
MTDLDEKGQENLIDDAVDTVETQADDSKKSVLGDALPGETSEAKNKKIIKDDLPGVPASAANSNQRWYIVHAYSGKEQNVIQHLKERIRLQNLHSKFSEIIVPTEEVVEMRGGQKRKSERKFFPGYVLVKMEMSDEIWHLVRHTPWVLGFIGGTSDKPAPITEAEANNILHRVQEGVEKPKPKILFQPGEVVRVIEGPFQDFDGVVETVNYEKSRLRVSVLIFGRSTPVELEFSQVQKQ